MIFSKFGKLRTQYFILKLISRNKAWADPLAIGFGRWPMLPTFIFHYQMCSTGTVS